MTIYDLIFLTKSLGKSGSIQRLSGTGVGVGLGAVVGVAVGGRGEALLAGKVESGATAGWQAPNKTPPNRKRLMMVEAKWARGDLRIHPPK